MSNRAPFAVGEWYHCYSRGVEGRQTFMSKADYERCLHLLYLCNSVDTQHRSDLVAPTMESIVCIPRSGHVTAIGAYCLMPNHFHLLLRETTEGGITMFMRKLGTAYTMYFNIKNERTGNLFVKPFRSRHIENDRYLQYVLQYIHFNPAELYEPGWKHGRAENLSRLYTQLTQYPYSSFGDHAGLNKVTRPILDEQIFSVAHQPSPKQMLEDAALFYAECAHQGDTLPA